MARKKLNKEQEKVLLDLIDELMAELDVTCADAADINTKSEKTKLWLAHEKFDVYLITNVPQYTALILDIV